MGSNVGFWTGAANATNDFANTALNLAQYQAGERHRRALEAESQNRMALDNRRMDMQQDQFDRQKKIDDYNWQKIEEQNKIDNSFVPVSQIAPNILKMDKTKKQYLETLRSAGFTVNETPDGDVYIPMKAVKHIGNMMKTNTEFQKSSLENVLTDLQTQNATISQQIAELTSKGKPNEKELAPLMEQQKVLKSQIANIFTSQEAFQKQQEKNDTILSTPVVDEQGNPVMITRSGKKTPYKPYVKPTSGGGTGGGRGTQMERDYQSYVRFAKEKYPNMRPMTMEEFREDRIKREATARQSVKNAPSNDDDPLGLR